MPRLGWAWLGKARKGRACQGEALCWVSVKSTFSACLLSIGMARHGEARFGKSWRGEAGLYVEQVLKVPIRLIY